MSLRLASVHLKDGTGEARILSLTSIRGLFKNSRHFLPSLLGGPHTVLNAYMLC